jgi:general L-amino acid transport system permease protein
MAQSSSLRAPALPPPLERQNLLGWVYKNLFNTWYNALLTILSLGLIYALLKPILVWVFTQARWEVIQVNLRLLMAGQYPTEQLWRAWACLFLLAGIFGLSWGVWGPRRSWISGLLLLAPVLLAVYPGFGPSARLSLLGLDLAGVAGFWSGRRWGARARRLAIALWVVYFPLVLLIIRGSALLDSLLPIVPSNLWGGLMLTFLLTVVGIVFSFPLGVLLALGRRSSLPAIRWVSVVYIEVIRGVPLVTILFMASVMVPLFLPGNVRIDRVLRAMVGIILFTSAYLAENVRGGLQAIPRGQFEAARAVGLSGFHTMGLVILPQALRIVIPVIMGLFIALFKDTSLVATIGLLELLGISRSILAQPQYVGYQREVYLFITVIYWVISYFMSYISRRLEVRLGVGER